MSVNEALALGMKVPDFMLESGFDRDRPGVILYSDREVEFDVNRGEILDGALDDDFALLDASGMSDVFTEKRYAVYLEWHGFTEGRAQRVIEYIRGALRQTSEVELWHIWMGSGERPLVRSRTLSIGELTPKGIKELLSNDVTKEFHEIPIQYRLVITEEKK